jgi:integrase
MTELRGAVQDYLKVRRALGHKLERAELLLDQFVTYCEQVGATRVTIEVAVAWATLPAGGSPGWWGQRLSVVRCFAAWLQTLEPDTEVPPTDICSARTGRAVPYLYTDGEVAAIMAAAAGLRWPLGRHTYHALVGLIAVTGLRVGEAIRLDRGDVELDAGVVRVWQSKFGKSREVLLHPSAVEALAVYARDRDRLCPTPRCDAFFLSSAGARLIYCNVWSTFSKLARTAGLSPRSPRCRPRIHDLRHSFACATLVDWHRTGADVQTLLPLLSTWMGHVDPKSTYWYLSASPELLGIAARRLEDTFEGGVER